MKKLLSLSAAAAGLLLAIGAADAAPLQPAVPTAATDLIEVRGLCGLGLHRGPWGRCVPNGVRYYGPYYYAYAAPYGQCWWRPGAWGPVRVCAW